ncbi:hypothetical protein L226DRAFT_145934 [Lentinus tigrinus ALCF2SS1-7]|uniref:Uncharacterized protein n=1 Tax=Lentinus tigrinus ALCF2SS1-6 TaxID=1328759 RepID=A0A5C2S4S6_9APHY|nr:hypothetical protein L227DRAFT_181953 [Lentinus tigrinus ALCF2SS1-6]RPD72751.1 hypothetical protein L226DRAFT_145934 [Lentinus tigrinus ALCF2SS1-7]
MSKSAPSLDDATARESSRVLVPRRVRREAPTYRSENGKYDPKPARTRQTSVVVSFHTICGTRAALLASSGNTPRIHAKSRQVLYLMALHLQAGRKWLMKERSYPPSSQSYSYSQATSKHGPHGSSRRRAGDSVSTVSADGRAVTLCGAVLARDGGALPRVGDKRDALRILLSSSQARASCPEHPVPGQSPRGSVVDRMG